MDKKTALVTGANKGIGLETCRQLAKKGFSVILTSRNRKKGEESARLLQKGYPDIIFCQLDVTDEESIKGCHDFVLRKYGKLDVLINNAGVLLDPVKENSKNEKEFGLDVKGFPDTSIFKVDEAKYNVTLETNFFGPLRMMKSMIPAMIKNDYGRVVNISSGMGQLSYMDGGWPSYRVSKTALNALTRIFASETAGYNIKINSMCPGWVKTDMGGKNAPRNPEEAADTIVWLASLPENGPTGKFFRDRKEIEW